MSDRGVAVGFSAFLHLLVLGLMVFTWSSEPELRRPPEIPPHVMATVMEETRRAPEANTAPAREEKDQKQAQEKAPKPEPKPEPEPRFLN